MPNYSYKAVFDCQQGSANYGKLYIIVTETDAGTIPSAFGFEILDPNGLVIKPMPNTYLTPDVTGSGQTALYNIPLDSMQLFLCGLYSIRVIALETPFFVGGTPPPPIERTQTASYTFCTVEKSAFKANMTTTVNYPTGKITLKDLTNVTGLTSLTRLMSITPPIIPNVSLPVVTTPLTQLIYSFTYTGVTYIAALKINAENETVNALPNWVFNHRLTISQTTNIIINAAVMTTVRGQADAVLKEIEEQLCKTLKCDCATTIRYMKIMRLLHNVQMAYFEGNPNVLYDELNELYRLLNITQPNNPIAPYTPIA